MKKKFLSLFEFLGGSVILFLLIALLLRINLIQSNLIKSSVVLLGILTVGHLAFKKILIFFGQIIISLLLFSSRIPYPLDNNKYFQIFTFPQFISKSEELLNHSKRMKYPFAFIILYIQNLSDKDYYSSITSQINFVLLENSRNYEPWGETDTRDIYIKALEVKNKKNLMDSIKRFALLLSRNQFYTSNKPVTFRYRLLGLYLNNQYIIKNEFNLLNNPVLNFIPYFDKIKTQSKDFEIIELE